MRQSRRENRLLEWALVVSLLVHLLGWAGYELGRKRGWWDHAPLLAWLHRPPTVMPKQTPPTQPTEPQLQFIQVAENDPEPPAQPKFYSDKNSHAANTEAEQEQNTPKLNGRQRDVPDTQTARRTQLTKTTSPTESQPEQAQTQPAQPQPTLKPGQLDSGTPQEAQLQPEPPHPSRPRTLKEALAQQPSQIAGVQMQQAGGVHRVALLPTFDAKATLFGDYDARFTQAIQQKWDDLLQAQNFNGECSGHVTLHFYLNDDGTITDITMVEHTVDMLYAYLCQRALTEPAPYAKWPEAMRQEIGGTKREMTFTFYYYDN